MYLVSIYFDEQTNRKIQRYVNHVAEKTGNTFMLDCNVPPHITVSAFESQSEEVAISKLENVAQSLQRGTLQWVSVGQFFPYVLYIAPVLNEYLHDMSQKIFKGLENMEDILISPHYQPFSWFPHSTIGKKLTKEEMQVALRVMQESFGVFEGEVVKIGLAKPNPHRDIISWELK